MRQVEEERLRKAMAADKAEREAEKLHKVRQKSSTIDCYIKTIQFHSRF